MTYRLVRVGLREAFAYVIEAEAGAGVSLGLLVHFQRLGNLTNQSRFR